MRDCESDLRPDEPVQRYERDHPGELPHIDIKKLGRFDKAGHRITGDRRQRARDIGWDCVFVAVDDHSRAARLGAPARPMAFRAAT